MTTTRPAPVDATRSSLVASRLAVAWQHPARGGRIEPVGMLSCHEDGFTFDYLERAAHVDGFRPFLGFPDLEQQYTSTRLFPIFAQRVMRPGRPDYQRHLAILSLDRDADQWDVLARSQGERQGDGIRLFAEPYVAPDGRTTVTFFVSGLRYRAQTSPDVEAALATLGAGDELALVAEPSNQVDTRALLLTEHSGIALGWVPHVLLDYAHTTLEMPEPPTVTVVAVQPREVVPSYRLLVRLTGWLPLGHQPFDGPQWRLAGTAPVIA